ncbi:MAG: methyltransferase domain-containing protein [Lentisphaerae bacterium]|nr:methyltransferase domain-containing protein [Lentisphaerota bacterium]MCP4102577.1 methyltransferase domain-containing protein [Lentisphaerota bacterium]
MSHDKHERRFYHPENQEDVSGIVKHGQSMCREDIAMWITDRLPLYPDMNILDIAAPNKTLARRLTDFVKKVVAYNYPCKTLKKHVDEAIHMPSENIEFVKGESDRLPFEDESFDLVICRFALHHFSDYSTKFAEMIRVCKKNGWVVVCDIITEHPELFEKYNYYERLRAKSHAYFLTHEDLQSLFDENDLRIMRNEYRDLSMEFDKWFDAGSCLKDSGVKNKMLSELREELQGGPQTGLQPYMKDGKLFFLRRINIIVGKKH